MEKYKIKYYDPYNLEPLYKETPFPKELVEKIESALENLNVDELTVTPMMIKPINLELYFCIIERDENGVAKLKYKITLSETNN